MAAGTSASGTRVRRHHWYWSSKVAGGERREAGRRVPSRISHPASRIPHPIPLFDRYLFVDWSGRATPSPRRECRDAIWTGEGARAGSGAGEQTETYWRTREACAAFLRERLLEHTRKRLRVLVGLDF